MFYKLIRDGVIFDVGEMWLRLQPKNLIMLRCEPSEAQFVMGRDDTIYRVQWLNPAPAEAVQYEVIDAAIIDRQEYEDLRAVLDDGEMVPVPEPVIPEPVPEPEPEPDQPQSERPMSVQEMRKKLAEQDATIQMLTECILEMSEVVYGGM